MGFLVEMKPILSGMEKDDKCLGNWAEAHELELLVAPAQEAMEMKLFSVSKDWKREAVVIV